MKALEIDVQPGDTFLVGDCTIACLDIESPRGQQWWRDHPCVVYYSDPPWDKGHARRFRSMAGAGDSEYPRLVEAVKAIIANGTTAFIEMSSVNPLDLWEDMGAWPWQRKWTTKYYKTRSAALWGGSKVQIEWPDLDDRTRVDLVKNALAAAPPGAVGDPCIGMEGLTAQAAIAAGRKCFGTEISPAKVRKVLGYLSQRQRATVRKLT